MLHDEDPRQECKPARDCHKRSDLSDLENLLVGVCEECPLDYYTRTCHEYCEGSECRMQHDCQVVNPDDTDLYPPGTHALGMQEDKCHACPGGFYSDDCRDPTKCTGTGCWPVDDFNAVWSTERGESKWQYADPQWYNAVW